MILITDKKQQVYDKDCTPLVDCHTATLDCTTMRRSASAAYTATTVPIH